MLASLSVSTGTSKRSLFLEAAHHAVRYYAPVKRFYQRKCAKTHAMVALKAVAHKLARACYYVLRDQVELDMHKAFS